MSRILTSIVLYRMQAADSPAFRSFCAAVQQNPSLHDVFHLIVLDNSPEPQALPPGCAEAYIHDATNPGLAKPYNTALERAAQEDIPWLLVLDQDTTVTANYLAEAAALVDSQLTNTKIVALVPKLMQDGIVQSPHTILGFRPTRPILMQQTGAADHELSAFNSGAVLRVSTLQEIGGFPLAYPLDFLDHATFRVLQRKGGRLYIMESDLEHNLAMLEIYRQNLPEVPKRLEQIFKTELRFYTELGSFKERLANRVRFVYRAIKSLRVGAYRRSLLLVRLAFTFTS